MSIVSVRLSDNEKLKLEKLLRSTGGLYKTSEIVGAAISMMQENNLYYAIEHGKHQSSAGFSMPNVISACIDTETSTLVREICVENSAGSCHYPKGTQVRIIPPNIIEFGGSCGLISRVFLYPGTRFFTASDIEIEYETLKKDSYKLKIVVIEDNL